MSMEWKKIDDDDTLMLCSSIEEDQSDSDDDLIQMENITDTDTSIEIIETITRDVSNVPDTEKPEQIVEQVNSPSTPPAGCRDTSNCQAESEGLVLRKCSVLVKKSEPGGVNGDESEKVLQFECMDEQQNKTGSANALRITTSEERSILESSFDSRNNSRSSNVPDTEEHVTKPPSPKGCRDIGDCQAESEKLVLTKCSVLVKKLEPGEMRKRKEGVNGDESEEVLQFDCMDDEQNMTDSASSQEISVPDSSFVGRSTNRSSAPYCAQTAPAENVGNNMMNRGHRDYKYECFLEEVESGKKLKTLKWKEKRYRKVRCLLCGDGTIVTYGNFARHVKIFHEPPVICEICHTEFNGVMIVNHMRKWHKEVMENNNVGKSDDTEDLSLSAHCNESVQYPTSHPVQSKPDLSNSIPSVSAKSANIPILSPDPLLDKQYERGRPQDGNLEGEQDQAGHRNVWKKV